MVDGLLTIRFDFDMLEHMLEVGGVFAHWEPLFGMVRRMLGSCFKDLQYKSL